MRTIELLAPAKNLACGIAAIDHGADAVYIGAARFGARQAAGNSIEDIAQLCRYAHQYGAKVHVTVNTIIYDDELEDTLRLIARLDSIGVDAVLVQDMGLLAQIKATNVAPHLSIHASTQCDTRSAEKVRWLQSLGCSRAVLARETSVEEITAIHHEVPSMELEAFVHGALCVSYSGLCYASQYCFSRSANRGECAQFCRLPFDLYDADGKQIAHDKYLLSLKDLCLIDHLEELMQAGVCSLKIEGRLKDIEYVKNVVSAYSQRLNEIIARHPDTYQRSSKGKVEYGFLPNLQKTFNRGYTTYFVHGRQANIFSPNTPKALGEYVGKVKEIRKDCIIVASTSAFANGDGLCFLKAGHELEGFRVNRVVGNHLYPYKMPATIRPGIPLYRNQDQAFEKLLQGKSAIRRLPVCMEFNVTSDGFKLTASSGTLNAEALIAFERQQAQRPQRESIVGELSKLGNTLFYAADISVSDEACALFVPRSLLAQARREVMESLTAQLDKKQEVMAVPLQGENVTVKPLWQRQYTVYPYLYNVANQRATAFYVSQGLEQVGRAFEIAKGQALPHGQQPLLMQCRHCIRFALGFCVRRGGKKPQWKEPVSLVLADGRRFRLEFDCQDCQMNVYAEK